MDILKVMISNEKAHFPSGFFCMAYACVHNHGTT